MRATVRWSARPIGRSIPARVAQRPSFRKAETGLDFGSLEVDSPFKPDVAQTAEEVAP